MDITALSSAPAATSNYRHWHRAFSDLQREHGFEPLRVTGKLPDDLGGTLYWNGPGRFDSFGERSPFWLDGDGAVTAFRIAAGRAYGATRMVRTHSYVAEQKRGRRLYSRYDRRSPRPLQELLGDTRNAGNTSVWHVHNRYYALCPQGSPTRIDPDDLTTWGEHEFPSVGSAPLSAHASYSQRRRAFYNFATARGPKPALHLHEFPDAGGDRLVATIPLRAHSFVHDFMVTDRYALFVVPPFAVEPWPLLLQLRTLSQCLQMRRDQPTEVITVELDAPHRVVRMEIEPCVVLHFANAYERGDELIADAPLSRDFERTWQWLNSLVRGAASAGPEPRLHRLRIDPALHKVALEPLSDAIEEQPRISPHVENREQRVVYSLGFSPGHTGLPNLLRKTDLVRGQAQVLALGSELYPAEGVFVPRSQPRTEDDGYLLTLVFDANAQHSHLSVIDARDFEAGSIAQLHFGQAVVPPFHGTWVDTRWSAPHPVEQ
jgi:all-trans-8'-apo-beta-carotenal 15,15'-oxygenase